LFVEATRNLACARMKCEWLLMATKIRAMTLEVGQPGLDDLGARVAQGEPGTAEYREGVIVGLILDQLWQIGVQWDSGERELVVVLNGDELKFLDAEPQSD
jgi:hypothetical protein